MLELSAQQFTEADLARILLMEDDLALSYQLATNLQDAGHDVQACGSATAAREELLGSDYDILITDVIVKVGSRTVPDGGIALISWVRRTAQYRALPIIAITGTFKYRGMEQILDNVRQLGADAGIEKPIDLVELFEQIDKLTTV